MESHYPVSVNASKPYELQIVFDNGEKRLFDVTPYLDDPFFAPLRSEAVFKAARVNAITVEWPFDIDICPDELYYNSKIVH